MKVKFALISWYLDATYNFFNFTIFIDDEEVILYQNVQGLQKHYFEIRFFGMHNMEFYEPI